MNTEIDNLTMSEALNSIEELIRKRANSYVVTPNVDHIVQLEKGGPLCDAYKNASLILCDGKPLIWLSKWYGTPIKEKISGSDIFPRLCALAAEKHYRLFFLGAKEGVALRAAEKLKEKFDGIQIVGTYSPPMGFDNNDYEMIKIEEMIKKADPHILIVALGCPKQELFMLKNKDRFNVPISFGLGATLDFEAGNVKRAPRWMSNNGLEWAYRLMQDPKRLIKRYLWNDITIFKLAIKYKLKCQ